MALFEAVLLFEVVFDAREADDEAESVEVAVVLESEETLLADVALAVAVSDEAVPDEACFGTVLVDSSTKNGV